MRKLSLAVLIPLLLLLNHCGSEKNPGVQETVVQEIDEPVNVKFSLQKRIVLSNISYPGIFVKDGVIYACGIANDENKMALETYDKNLNLSSRKMFNKGQGPGDVGEGVYFYVYDNYIYAPDNTQDRVNIFDKDFNFKKFVKLVPGYYPVTFIKDGGYFICAQETYEYQAVKRSFRFNLVAFPSMKRKVLFKLKPFSTFTPKKRLIVFETPGHHFFYKNEKLYFINMKTYKITVFDFDGKMLKSVKVDVDIKKVPQEKKVLWMKDLMGASYREGRFAFTGYIQPASYMIPLKKGFAVARREGYSRECKGFIEGDFFDYHLKLLGKIRLPCFFKIFYSPLGYITKTFQYEKGNLYLVNELGEEYFLERWNVSE